MKALWWFYKRSHQITDCLEPQHLNSSKNTQPDSHRDAASRGQSFTLSVMVEWIIDDICVKCGFEDSVVFLICSRLWVYPQSHLCVSLFPSDRVHWYMSLSSHGSHVCIYLCTDWFHLWGITACQVGQAEQQISEWQMYMSCCIVRHITEQPGCAIPNDVEIDGSVIDRWSVLTNQPGR